MKKSLLVFGAAALVAGIIPVAISNSSGPPASRTGAPGEQTCAACHNQQNGPNTVSLHVRKAGTAFVSGNPSLMTYLPDSTYTVRFSMDNNSNTRSGFQSTILGSSGASVGTLTAGSGTALTTANVSGQSRRYVAHNTPKSGSSVNWEFTWKAPASGTGNSTIYAVGNNAAGGSAGSVKTTSLALTEGVPSSVKASAVLGKLSIFPNPVAGAFSVTLNSQKATTAHVRIFNLAGAVVADLGQHTLDAGENTLPLSLVHKPAAGSYLIQISANGQTLTQKLNVI